MPEVVIGTSPTTGEVLVRDTDTGDLYWEPGTSEQIADVTDKINSYQYESPDVYETYEPPPPPVPVIPIIPPVVVITYIAPLTPAELAAAALAETTGGYAGIAAITWIIERFNLLSQYLYTAYTEILDLPWPVWKAAYPFYLASSAASQIAWGFYSLGEWAYNVAAWIQTTLSWDTIWSYILSYIPNLEEIRDWFYGWWGNIYGVITDWWGSTSTIVLSWIEVAVSGVRALVAQVEVVAVKLRADIDQFIDRLPSIDAALAWWSSWTGEILSVVNTWWSDRLLDVQDLINSAFLERDSWWAGWQEIRAEVSAFFEGPLDWLESKFTDWFLGPEV